MKKIAACFFTFLITLSLYSFEWPIDEPDTNTTRSFFGQNKGGILSTSIVFTNPSEIHSAEKGKVLIVMEDLTDDSDFFPSTLGTSCIIQHDNNLISVYGNIETDTLNKKNLFEKTSIDSGDEIGYTGSSGWQDDKSGLEFQIVDTNNKSAINPKIILTRSTEKNTISISNIFLENKNGDIFDLRNTKSFNSGLYRFYEVRNDISVPYRSSVLINGVVSDQISYDTIIQENGKSCVIGKKKYSSSDVYPDNTLLLLGEAMMTSGKTSLTITVQDILENSKQVTYNLNIY